MLHCAASGLAAEGARSLPGDLQSRADGTGRTTYRGEGAHYEIIGPSVTVFLLRRDDGAIAPPMIRVAYVGDRWIDVRAVRFIVGGQTYGPFADL